MDIDPQVILVIIFLVVGALRWVYEQFQQKKNQEYNEQADTLEDMYDEFQEEMRQRQEEALRRQQAEAQPQQETLAPPPLPQASPEPPQLSIFKAPPTAQPVEEVIIHPQTFEVQKPQLSEAEKAALENFNKRKNRKRKNTGATSGFRKLLASPDAAKQAVILKEILDKPRSVQSI